MEMVKEGGGGLLPLTGFVDIMTGLLWRWPSLLSTNILLQTSKRETASFAHCELMLIEAKTSQHDGGLY
jgi:hypothetical protein